MQSTAMAASTANIPATRGSGPQPPSRLAYDLRPALQRAADRFTTDAGPAATVLRVLAACDIPFATFDLSGARTSVSEAATLLLERDADRAATWSRARSLVAAALGSMSRVGHRGAPPAVLAPNGRWALRAYALPSGDPSRAAVVLFLPAHTSALAPSAAPGTPSQAALPALKHWRLTARELEVARLIACGEQTKVIAAALGISVHTACRHTERIYAKLGVRNRSQAVLALSRPGAIAQADGGSEDDED